ncbi:hypothetical protein Agabi119p4_5677 [Agaricus bisporus var. burnettii]|uniref:Ricin B lectin domain-containing protein n=1 Tax=Agaricus bisporus var. burnettii TaxID=192524 RepID=A0A8H7F2C8_AGABI|nr:hypothetical protein Agabi119p4_5677 [Agaricus bisporus var. burnettii]
MLFPSFIFSAFSIVTFGAIFAQAQTLAAGRYRIFNGEQSARSYPPARQGTRTYITMSNEFASIWERWDVSSDGNGGYLIHSTGTDAIAYADPTLNAEVQAALDGQTTWFIENKGNNGQDDLYAIKVPFQDLLWTNTPRNIGDNYITLKGSDGSAEQRFVFQSV